MTGNEIPMGIRGESRWNGSRCWLLIGMGIITWYIVCALKIPVLHNSMQ